MINELTQEVKEMVHNYIAQLNNVEWDGQGDPLYSSEQIINIVTKLFNNPEALKAMRLYTMSNITAKELGAMLLKIHSHRNDEIVYREKDIINLLVSLGFPEPDFTPVIEDVCVVCSKPATFHEPRFGYSTCEEHKNIPPFKIHEVMEDYRMNYLKFK